MILICENRKCTQDSAIKKPTIENYAADFKKLKLVHLYGVSLSTAYQN